ncbi:MAG: hypothetical protein MUC28_04395 [Planctomycetes bacterium]|nr:hypothetical protein [Planctomycetota bacterium]
MDKRLQFNTDRIFAWLILLVASLSIAGASVYRLYALTALGVAIAIALALALLYIILRYSQINKNELSAEKTGEKTKFNKINFVLISGYLTLAAWCFIVLCQSRTAAAIISPWQTVPAYFFLIYGASSLWLLMAVKRQGPAILPLTSLHYFLSFAVVLIVYRLGYGFDPFVHRATENLIIEAGAVDPKPFYYLGQYSLIVILHKITALPTPWLDKLLVPVLAALFLPYYFYRLLSRWFADKTAALFLVIIILILPFSVFIVTTPQNLAYLFLLLIIIIGLSCRSLFELILIYILALAALAAQPIAGIPAFLFALGLTVYHYDRKKYKKLIFSSLFVLAVASLPLAFYLVERGQAVYQPAPETDSQIGSFRTALSIPSQEDIFLNFAYLFGFNFKLIIILLILSGAWLAYRYREKCRVTALYAGLSLALAISYLVAALLPFNFLISYERSDFPNRLLFTAGLFALPFVFLALYRFIFKLLLQRKIIQFIFFFFAASLLASSLYLSYPRFDRYFNSHLYAVSQTDADAVRWINSDASGDYIVLANQQVSAAALQEYGFKKYYKIPSPSEGEGGGEVFYYPIPTGGPLYRYYLDMVYEKADRATMLKAMSLVGAESAYFVLNKYWWAFPKILAEAKLSADFYQEIGNGEVYVFKYVK